MTNWAKVIEGKVRIAKQGAKPSKPSGNARIPPGQKQGTFWEVRGYHNDADPWKEERFRGSEM